MKPLTFEAAEKCISTDWERDPVVREACLRILNWARHQPKDAVSHLSIQRLWKSAAVQDLALMTPTLSYLTGARVPLFDVLYEFIDGETIEQIDLHEVKDANETGEFYHPVTGEKVPDYESKLFMYFALSSEASSIGDTAR